MFNRLLHIVVLAMHTKCIARPQCTQPIGVMCLKAITRLAGLHTIYYGTFHTGQCASDPRSLSPALQTSRLHSVIKCNLSNLMSPRWVAGIKAGCIDLVQSAAHSSLLELGVRVLQANFSVNGRFTALSGNIQMYTGFCNPHFYIHFMCIFPRHYIVNLLHTPTHIWTTSKLHMPLGLGSL